MLPAGLQQHGDHGVLHDGDPDGIHSVGICEGDGNDSPALAALHPEVQLRARRGRKAIGLLDIGLQLIQKPVANERRIGIRAGLDP